MKLHALDHDLVGYGGGPDGVPAGRSAVSVFVAALMTVIAMVFLLTTVAYLGRSNYPDWRALADTAAPLADPWRLWMNTLLLALGSLALHAALAAESRGRPQALRAAVGIAGAFGVAFLVGQLTVWNELVAGGHGVAQNPANSFFYLITGLHGVHLAVGIAVLAGVALRVLRRPAGAHGEGLRLTSRYWDFLLVLWLAMFALVASSRETLDTIAAFCGMR